MTTPHTDYLIVPAWSDQAGHCRIVARESDGNGGHDLQHYRAHPEQWKEAGLMNSQGRVVCLNAPAEVLQEFRDCEPLMAGTVILVSATASSLRTGVICRVICHFGPIRGDRDFSPRHG